MAAEASILTTGNEILGGAGARRVREYPARVAAVPAQPAGDGRFGDHSLPGGRRDLRALDRALSRRCHRGGACDRCVAAAELESSLRHRRSGSGCLLPGGLRRALFAGGRVGGGRAGGVDRSAAGGDLRFLRRLGESDHHAHHRHLPDHSRYRAGAGDRRGPGSRVAQCHHCAGAGLVAGVLPVGAGAGAGAQAADLCRRGAGGRHAGAAYRLPACAAEHHDAGAGEDLHGYRVRHPERGGI